MDPQITIIIPCHNSEPYIAGIVSDLDAQTFRAFHVIFVDDASEKDIADTLEQLHPSFRYEVLYANCHNPGGARNIGIDLIEGEYTYFVDSDDRIDPDFLDYAMRAVRQYSDCIPMGCKINITDPAENTMRFRSDYAATRKSLNDMHLVGRLLFRSDILLGGIRFPELRYAEDFLFICQYCWAADIQGIARHTGTFCHLKRSDSVKSEYIAEDFELAMYHMIPLIDNWCRSGYPQPFVDKLLAHISTVYKHLHV